MKLLVLLIRINLLCLFSSILYAEKLSGNEFQDQLADLGLGPIMIIISSGSFVMGDSQGVGQSYEKPIHNVTFNYSFAIGKYPITFKEYDKFTTATNRPLVSDYHWGRENRPVINVNLKDAQAYAQWISKLTGKIYRLPSEAEWEYAARAMATTNYSWGNKVGHNRANCNGCGSKWDSVKTSPVDYFSANSWGLYDTHGNTWDLTADCWNYSYKNAPVDGRAWRTGDCLRGVIRGGSLGDRPIDLRSATRLRNYSTTRTVVIGFRLVREILTKSK